MFRRILFTCLALCCLASALNAQDSRFQLTKLDDRVRVEIDGELFTEYIFKGYEKPILYPIIGPSGAALTRNYPMEKGVPNEADDHPHHKSIWFGHMEVNGTSFWHSGETAGTTQQTEVDVSGVTIRSKNDLVDIKGKLVATDSREIRFAAGADFRTIDYTVTYYATESELVFGDNKDGQMGIRMHPNLRIKGPVAKGKAVNARGDKAKSIWGKRAEWIDYWAPIDGTIVGVAMFDHPQNLRYPTWWHARDYGLLSANPFGIHHFEELSDPKLGEYRIEKGESLTFRHRFLFHLGDASTGKVAEHFDRWIQE